MKTTRILGAVMALTISAAPVLGFANTVTKTIPTVQITAEAGWKKNSTGWWYEYSDGSYPANRFATIEGQKYWFNSAGYMHTGWLNLNGIWYYCIPGDGYCAVGWKYINNKQYCFNPQGQMRVGFQWVGGKKYYFEARCSADSARYGMMLTGFFSVNGKTYYAYPDGHLALGEWVFVNNRWHYFNADGTYNPNKRR